MEITLYSPIKSIQVVDADQPMVLVVEFFTIWIFDVVLLIVLLTIVLQAGGWNFLHRLNLCFAHRCLLGLKSLGLHFALGQKRGLGSIAF